MYHLNLIQPGGDFVWKGQRKAGQSFSGDPAPKLGHARGPEHGRSKMSI